MTLLNLNKKLQNLDRPVAKRKKKHNRKTWLIRFGVVILLLLILIIWPLRNIYVASKKGSQSGRQLLAAVKQENLDQIRQGLVDTQTSVKEINGSLNWLFWLRVFPFIGGYYTDAKHLAQAAESELEAAIVLADSLDPYKNELGLVGQPAPGQDRVAMVVKILNKVLPDIDRVEPYLKKAREEVEDVDISKYPQSYRSRQVRSRLDQTKNFIIGAHVAITEGKEALQIAPGALGEPKAKTYLMLFQNDKELRATGGFITAYAFLKVDKGHLSTTASDDIYRLDERLLNVCKSKICPLAPPTPIVKYLPETSGKTRSAWSMRDSNISPNLPTAAGEFERMYQFLGEGLPYDGIITIDSQVVEELIKVTGPVDIYGISYSSEKDKRCNCPNVIYELEHYAEVASRGEQDRKAVLGTLMQQILAKSLGAGPDKILDFINTGVKLASDKHIMFYMHDQKTQQALSKLHWTGEIRSFNGDYLHINDSNFAGGKSNLYVEEKVTDEITIDGGGNVKHKVTIDYKNPQPSNIWLNGILRDYVRLYVPKGSKLVSSKGSDDPINTINDEGLNKTYFDAFITVRPQNSRTLSFEYALPEKVSGKDYSYLIQKQPGAKDHRYTVKINGSKKAEFDLTSDRELNLSF